MVHALRDDGRDPPPADPAELTELLERHRAGGMRITTELDGARAGLPRSVAWAGHRILQEALTNAARRGTGEAQVRVSYRPEAVEITVTNPTGTNGSAPRGGHGIVGMRERASLLGGTLETGTENGIFRLHGRLPCTETPSTQDLSTEVSSTHVSSTQDSSTKASSTQEPSTKAEP